LVVSSFCACAPGDATASPAASPAATQNPRMILSLIRFFARSRGRYLNAIKN
jgi:hypothetical protein